MVYLDNAATTRTSPAAMDAMAHVMAGDAFANPSSQHAPGDAALRALEEATKAHVLDRSALILDIFSQRAKTREGKLQVELAQYKYYLPRLTTWNEEMGRLGGGIGTRGPGETQLETDKRHIRARISKLQSALK